MSTQEDLYPSRDIEKPQVIKRQDPVLYNNKPDQGPISETLLRQYERDGYLLLPELFSQAEVNEFLAELERMQQDHELLATEAAVTEPSSNALRSVFQIHRNNLRFSQVAADPRIADIARFILDDNVYIHQSRLNFKPGFNGREFYWHSDFETWHSEDGMPRMRALSASILLTDNTEFNGALMVMPGSQREFIGCVGKTPDDYYRDSLKAQTIGTPDMASLAGFQRRYGLRSTAAKAGTVLLFDCNLMHGSNSNISASPRSNLFFVYNAVSNRVVAPFNGNKPRPEFLATRETFAPLISPEPHRKAG
ncbi:ectoine hydroxylase [Marinobacterium zhoushanense]|uniref:Ectoine hydroxylase n=1 Tax=Marinobacterium zhoushanense TaxID=1679163 RepID=A0ABQ1KF49_9GAMM|nr:ectoine hydroxylase [Marinobacterium zhoushanense]GGB97165.1 ectoine hydroxylase [Marinobacterium zhoushanense]